MHATTTDRSDYRRGLAMSALGMLVISPDALLLRLIETASTWDIVFWRMLFQSASLFAWMMLSGGTDALARLRGIGRLGLASTAVLAAAQIGFVLAISNTSAANTLVLLATMPLFGALLGWLLLRERVAARTAAAIAVASAGIAVIFADALGQGRWLGDVLALGTALLYAGNLVILRKAGPAVMVPSLCLSGLMAAAVALPLADPLAVGMPDLPILAWLGLVQLPVALILFFGGTRFVPAAEVALMSLIETALGPLLAWAGAGEAIRGSALAGGALVMLAIGGNSLLAVRGGRR